MPLRFKDLPPDVRKKIQADERAAKKAAGPQQFQASRILLAVLGDIPRVTHHAKRIISLNLGGGRRGPARLADTPELVALRKLYSAMIPRNDGLPLRPPVRLTLQFVFEVAGDLLPGIIPGAAWSIEKPDCDNATKPAADTLAEKGWVVDDKHVAQLHVSKVTIQRVPRPIVRPGLFIILETILQPVTLLQLNDDFSAAGVGRIQPQPALATDRRRARDLFNGR